MRGCEDYSRNLYQFLCAVPISSSSWVRNSFSAARDSQTYSFPFRIKKTLGSASLKLLFLTPLAQNPPYCGTYFEGFAFESGEICRGAEIVCRSLISALVFRTPFDGFLLGEMSNRVISLQNYAIAVQIYLVCPFLNPYLRR